MSGLRAAGVWLVLALAATPLGAQESSSRSIAPGVRHTSLMHPEGPWAVHILEVDLAACGVDLRGAKGGGRVIGRETTSSMARAAEAALGRPVLAAVNADFFTFDPPGRPETVQVIDGVVVKSEARLRVSPDSTHRTAQPVFALDADERPHILAPAFDGVAHIGGRWSPVLSVNAPDSLGRLVLYNGYFAPATPADSTAVELVVRVVTRGAAGDTVAGVVTALDEAPAGVTLRDSTIVFAARGDAAAVLRSASAGDTVRWLMRVGPAGMRVAQAIGGLPPLLTGGRDGFRGTYWMPASFVDQRHPRTLIGWQDEQHIVILVVDGRQPGYSEGMTLDELAGYARGLGLREALNFDGGGSTTLVLRGVVANRPSDAEGERAVANALLVLGAAPGRCAP